MFTAPACSQNDGEKGELKKDSLVEGALSYTQFTTIIVFYYSIIKTFPHQFLRSPSIAIEGEQMSRVMFCFIEHMQRYCMHIEIWLISTL